MIITYNDTRKDLPAKQLYHLFYSAGWAGSNITSDLNIINKFNIPYINSTLVISAWDNERLVGAVRVLSDKFIRSVIYDLVIDPEYKNMGIGKELVRRCIEHFPNTEWLVQTENHIKGFYEKIGFKIYDDVVLTIPSIYQRREKG
mgnify:FL=1